MALPFLFFIFFILSCLILFCCHYFFQVFVVLLLLLFSLSCAVVCDGCLAFSSFVPLLFCLVFGVRHRCRLLSLLCFSLCTFLFGALFFVVSLCSPFNPFFWLLILLSLSPFFFFFFAVFFFVLSIFSLL